MQEHVELIKGVIAGKPINEAKQVAESTAVAIMGRMSSYSGELVRWSSMMEDAQSPFYQLTCKPTALDFERNTVTLAPEVAAVPGEAFGPSGYLRFSYALGDEDIVEGIGRIKKLITEG